MDEQGVFSPEDVNEAISPETLSATYLLYSLYFVKWQKQRRNLTRFRVVLPFLGLGLGILLVTFVYAAVVEGLTGHGILGMVLFLIFYSSYVIGSPLYLQRRLREYSRYACIHAAMEGAKHLENNDPVKSSWYVEKVLAALTDMLKEKTVAVPVKPVSPRKIMIVTPESIPRRAVLRAVQENESAQELQAILGELGQGLQRASKDDPVPAYVAASTFLSRLYRKTQRYHRQTQTFFDRHPILVTSTRIVGPILVPGLATLLAKLLGSD